MNIISNTFVNSIYMMVFVFILSPVLRKVVSLKLFVEKVTTIQNRKINRKNIFPLGCCLLSRIKDVIFIYIYAID